MNLAPGSRGSGGVGSRPLSDPLGALTPSPPALMARRSLSLANRGAKRADEFANDLGNRGEREDEGAILRSPARGLQGGSASTAPISGVGKFIVLLFVQQDSPTAHRALAMCRRFLRTPGDIIVLVHVNSGSEAGGRRLMEKFDAADVLPSSFSSPTQSAPSTLALPQENKCSLAMPMPEGGEDCMQESLEVGLLSGDSGGSWLRKMLVPVAQDGVLLTMLREIKSIGPRMVAIAEAWDELPSGQRAYMR